MPEKKSRASSRRAKAEEVAMDGVLGRIVDNAFDNPALTGGLFVMALTASAIVSNALFLQNARHPEPLFSTRPPLVVERHAPQAPLPPHRTEDDRTGAIEPPLPRPAPIPPRAEAPRASEDTLVRDIQTILAARGLYLGALDGKYGALSRSAIVAYQKAAGLEQTGEVSTALLEHIRNSPAAPPQAPTMPPPVVAAIPPSAPPAAEAPAGPSVPSAEEVRAEIEKLRYQRVQAALNSIGYGPVGVDGLANEATSNAIRRFQLDNGLPIDGVVGEEVVERLVAIGAMPAA